ncbi:UNVERIFIED_CONTAM: hypothetical protein Slati_4531500 [Sesamum latifolium]|uniref:Aminotransferase-like plant mobile domain-containing protein n=1 Tax=Sesamum latifolium TaxID=2727402 RepID=A0AAW2SGA1_9LAMI
MTSADAEFILPNRHIAAIGTSWRTPQSKYGEVSFYPGYWEWTEDVLGHHANILHAAKIHAAVHASLFTYVCNKHVLQAFLELWCPSTNTLHTAVEEVSLSLWDIRGLCGLPVCGGFYDEVVPSSKDLLGDETSPPLRSSRKRVHEPKLSRNPSGDVYASNLPRAKDHDEPFTILQIPEDIRDETYVAAFLSCRLCNFVFPHNKVGKIHASTFKVASRMAHGTSSKLLIPDSISSSPLVTKEYADWWAKCNKNSLEKNTRVILKLNHPPNLEKGYKDNQVMPATESDAAKLAATTSKRRHNVLVDTPVAPLSGENDVISALSISNGQFSNPQPLDIDTISVNSSFFQDVLSSFMPLNELALYLVGLEEGVLVTPEDRLSVETPSKRSKIVLPTIMEKPPLVENILEKPKKTFEAPSWPYSSTEDNDFCLQLIKTEAEQMLLKFYWERICQNIMTTFGGKTSHRCFDQGDGHIHEGYITFGESLEGVLKKQLEELQRKEELINSSFHGAKGALINFQKDVATKKEKISMLENTPYHSETEVEALEKMEAFLEESKRDLANFNLFVHNPLDVMLISILYFISLDVNESP